MKRTGITNPIARMVFGAFLASALALGACATAALAPACVEQAYAASEIILGPGDTHKLKTMTNCKSSKTSVATVTSNGKITALKTGVAKVTGYKNGRKLTYKVDVRKVRLSTTSMMLHPGQSKHANYTDGTKAKSDSLEVWWSYMAYDVR